MEKNGQDLRRIDEREIRSQKNISTKKTRKLFKS